MDYQELELHLSKESPGIYHASVMENGNVAADQKFELRPGELRILEKLRFIEEQVVNIKEEEKEPSRIEKKVPLEVLIRGKEKFTDHIEFGKELYNKVLSGKLGEYFKKNLEDAQNNGMGLRISLRFEENVQDITNLPWEFLHDGENFLVTRRNMLISRLPAGLKKVKSAPVDSALNMLVVVSNPDDPFIPALNTELEQEVILEAVDKLHRDHKMEVDFTEDASLETIQSYLNEKEYHIVHFTGHGAFIDNRGYLILETEDGKARKVDNTTISELLADCGVRLVVLSACQSGKTSNREAYADLASMLIKAKIPAVVAMQYSILDLSATKFAGEFYEALAHGKPVDLALTEARIIMKNSEMSNGIDFATPLLYLLDPDCIATGKIKPAEIEIFTKPSMLGDVQVMMKGFVGRRKELRLLQKDFISDKKRAAIIHGFGGIGKTVLATRLGLRMNQYFDGMFGIKCTALTKPEDILNRLNAFLLLARIQELNQVLYQPVPLETKTSVLVSILNQHRFLIILDNFEVCLDDTRKFIVSPELRAFVQHLLNNTITNTKYIITTRYDFDPLEGRLTGAIEHISLPELPFAETMWAMNNYENLTRLGKDKKKLIYKTIGGHPWTIGQFAHLASKITVDGLLQELAPLRQELINFTLLDKSYSKLDENAKSLLLRASVYQEAVPYEALSWIIGDEIQPSPPIRDQLSKLIEWGLMARQEERDQTLYIMHTLVRDFAHQELEKEKLDRKNLLIRAAQYYEYLAKASNNLWDILKAREYYYQAEEWDEANDIVESTWQYLVRWGYIELTIDLLNQSINTTSGTKKAIATGNLAQIFQRLGDWKTALNIYNEVKGILEKEGDKRNVAAVLHNIGVIHKNQGNYLEAINSYQQSMKLSEELGNKQGIAITLHQLGMIHQYQGNYPEAINEYQQSMKLSEEMGDKQMKAYTLHQLGMIHQDQGNYSEAINKYQQSMKLSEEMGDKHGIAGTLHQLGIIHQDQGNYSEAINKYQQSMKLSEEMGDKHGIAITLHNLGMIHQDQGNYSEAINKYQQSMKLSEELGDKLGIARVLHNLGMIHQDQGNYSEAINKYQQSMKIKEELGDKHGIATTLHQLGMIHQDQGNYSEAINRYQQSMKIKEELGDKHGIATTLHALGMVYEEKDEDFPAALENYLIALSIYEQLGNPNGENVKNLIAGLKEKMGEEAFNKAVQEIERKYGS